MSTTDTADTAGTPALGNGWAEQVLGHVTEPVLVFDEQGCRDANAAAMQLFGFRNRDFLKHCLLADLAPPLQPDGTDSEAHIDRLLGGGGQHANGEAHTCLLRHSDGSTFWAEITASRIAVEGESLLQIGVRDTSVAHDHEDDLGALRQELQLTQERLKLAAHKLDYSAASDPITGLWTGKQLRRLAHIESERALRYGQSVSIVSAVIDNAEALNDDLGDAQYDCFWIELAALVNRNVRTADVVARSRSDGFAVLAPATAIDAANIVADKLSRSIAQHAFANSVRPEVRFACVQFEADEDSIGWLARSAALYSSQGNGGQ